ncbi:MAG: replicative DNA helicase [Ruminococcaceae bacterium]|nr:replicative DNA helicase [Oscillospiraceae bacterium]
MEDKSLLVKQMPISIEAEQAFLGSIIRKPEAFDAVGGMLTVDDFYLEEHKNIYLSLTKMYTESRTIDPVTLANALVESGIKDQTGGIQYIALLAESVPSAANIKDYAKIVKDKSTLRRLITACDEINKEAYDEASPVRSIIDAAEQKIFDISNNNDTKELRHISDILQSVYKDLEMSAEMRLEKKGTKTGFSSLDEKIVEMGKGDFIIVGARPGMGKTSFVLNIGTNVAKKTKKAVAIFSLEMTCEQLVTRVISSEAMVDSQSLRTGVLSTEDWENIAGVISELSGCDIFVDDTSQIGVTEMRSKLRRIPNLGLVIIDYIGLMQSSTNVDNRAQQVGDISRNLKIMAKDFGVPIVCCAQLNRGTEARGVTNKRPTLADLRDSGSIEQDADIVMFLYRDTYYKDIGATTDGQDTTMEDTANTAEVIIAKNRHGSVGNVKMGWIGQFTKFRSLEENRS